MHGRILYNEWYLLDYQDSYIGNPKWLLLRHGQYQNFRVNGTAWAFSGTICVDQAGDESCNPRVKFSMMLLEPALLV